MSMEAYTFGLIGVAIISILLFKLKIPMVSFTWGILAVGISAISFDSPYIAFSPYLQLAVALLGVLLALYSVQLYRGVVD